MHFTLSFLFVQSISPQTLHFATHLALLFFPLHSILPQMAHVFRFFLRMPLRILLLLLLLLLSVNVCSAVIIEVVFLSAK
ncbi:hypothetical protein BDC45DRAFT_88425 [Circinella umbellata]|nr:hypothetical protein BDC45DRAFT_88425 [Circinella umbellata]